MALLSTLLNCRMNRPFSAAALAFTAVFIFLSQLYFHRWDRSSILSGGDSWEYYAYNPAFFIHHDLDNLKTSLTYRFQEDHWQHIDTSGHLGGVEVSYPNNGDRVVIKATGGVAIMQLPFFFIAHALAILSGVRANGYSPVYIILMHLSLFFYAMLGLVFLRRILIKYYSDLTAALVIVSIGIGTNLYYFLVESTPMAHPYLFCLFSILIYCTIQFYDTLKWKYAMAIGFTCGLIAIIRPNDIIGLAIPVFYGLTGFGSIKDRFKLFYEQPLKIFAAIIMFFPPLFPQMLYWKTMAGSWIYYSYGSEGFDFRHPHIIEGLFGFSNGWFAYTPLMLFAVAGVPLLLVKNKAWFPVLAIILPIHTYVLYSWFCWIFINGFGSRPWIDLYPLLAIPLGAFIQWMWSSNAIGRLIIIPVLLFFILLNVFQTWQVDRGLLSSEFASRLFVEKTMFKTKLTENDLIAYDCNCEQPENLKYERTIKKMEFEDSTDSHFCSSYKATGKFSYRMDGQVKYAGGYSISIAEAGLKPGDWIRASTWCRSEQGCDVCACSSLVVALKRDNDFYMYKFIRLQNKIIPTKLIHAYHDNAEGYTGFFVQIPKDVRADDKLCLFFDHGNAPVLIDDVALEVWR